MTESCLRWWMWIAVQAALVSVSGSCLDRPPQSVIPSLIYANTVAMGSENHVYSSQYLLDAKPSTYWITGILRPGLIPRLTLRFRYPVEFVGVDFTLPPSSLSRCSVPGRDRKSVFQSASNREIRSLCASTGERYFLLTPMRLSVHAPARISGDKAMAWNIDGKIMIRPDGSRHLVFRREDSTRGISFERMIMEFSRFGDGNPRRMAFSEMTLYVRGTDRFRPIMRPSASLIHAAGVFEYIRGKRCHYDNGILFEFDDSLQYSLRVGAYMDNIGSETGKYFFDNNGVYAEYFEYQVFHVGPGRSDNRQRRFGRRQRRYLGIEILTPDTLLISGRKCHVLR